MEGDNTMSEPSKWAMERAYSVVGGGARLIQEAVARSLDDARAEGRREALVAYAKALRAAKDREGDDEAFPDAESKLAWME